MRVKPATTEDGVLLVRDPHTRRPLPAEGAEVPDTTFWQRRLRSGDVVLVEDAAPEAAPLPPAPAPRRRATDQLEAGAERPLFDDRQALPGVSTVAPLTTRDGSKP